MKQFIAVFLSALLIGVFTPIDSIASSTAISDSQFIAVTGGDWHSLGLRKEELSPQSAITVLGSAMSVLVRDYWNYSQ